MRRCRTGRSPGAAGSRSAGTWRTTQRRWRAGACSISHPDSGLCAIAALRAGAAEATGADIDAFSAAAIELNARANGCRATVVARDVLAEDPPEADVILAGDCWYDAGLAERVLPWLQRARERGIAVLVGDPGRRYLPTSQLVEIASYEVRTTTELEDLDRKRAGVYELRPAEQA